MGAKRHEEGGYVFRFDFILASAVKMCILHIMKRASATAVARKFSHFLGEVEHGHAVQILKHGRPVARLVPDCGFMDGKRAAALFADHVPDPQTANAIERELLRLKQEEDDALAHRY
jgi:prevent-host-death family protein